MFKVIIIMYLLSRWIEAYPTLRNDAVTVANLLLLELPKFGNPETISSDNGPHFTGKVVLELSKAL